MVTQVLSLTRSGLADFVLQRLTAVVLAAYTVCILAFFIGEPVTYVGLTEFFWSLPMQIFSTLATLSITAHAWIGMWTIGTDYLRPAHVGGNATSLRFVYQIGCLLALFVYLAWSLGLIWQF
ncbi:MAG: succinate dehydrogenase, hydrophobic membrane anchor protein [Gammaproteobacteria bacterium]|jgi:succinate dehydrogenase / fumarate reductase, membrane anchor subunit|nr:succinate dehydrogenase, hydrophobic membrane anchor protein [Gammaproteobacteria bacterium]MCH1551593.1 succinate dehydrogenase, hydrophobic membrane anchor protein [Pseudomonadales bacterium]